MDGCEPYPIFVWDFLNLFNFAKPLRCQPWCFLITSFQFGLCCRKFVLCLLGQCPCLCAICYRWQHTGVAHLSLQADGKFAFEEITVFVICRPACHDSSLYLFVLVILLAVVLPQVHVAFIFYFYQHNVHVDCGLVFAMFIFRPICL